MNTGSSLGSFVAKSSRSAYSLTSQSSALQYGAAMRNKPATDVSAFSSERYFNRIEPPSECPTRISSPSSAASSLAIRPFHASYSGLSASGISGYRTSYPAPNTSCRLVASFLSSSSPSCPAPWINTTRLFTALTPSTAYTSETGTSISLASRPRCHLLREVDSRFGNSLRDDTGDACDGVEIRGGPVLLQRERGPGSGVGVSVAPTH